MCDTSERLCDPSVTYMHTDLMCGSRKYPPPPPTEDQGNSEGEGGLSPEISKLGGGGSWKLLFQRVKKHEKIKTTHSQSEAQSKYLRTCTLFYNKK